MSNSKRALQSWVEELSLMQQSVLMSAVRGPDGIRKYHPCKQVIKWFRRSILLSAFEGKAIDNPYSDGGGSFTGPAITSAVVISDNWETAITDVLDNFLISRDELPYHYTIHLMHAIEIVGYKHSNFRIRKWWNMVYLRMVNALHLKPESEEEMDLRLGDNEANWMSRSDEAGSCSS